MKVIILFIMFISICMCFTLFVSYVFLSASELGKSRGFSGVGSSGVEHKVEQLGGHVSEGPQPEPTFQQLPNKLSDKGAKLKDKLHEGRRLQRSLVKDGKPFHGVGGKDSATNNADKNNLSPGPTAHINIGEDDDFVDAKENEESQTDFFNYEGNDVMSPGEELAPGSAYFGEIRNVEAPNLCLDAWFEENAIVSLYECHGQGGNQLWELTEQHELRRGDYCADYFGDDVRMFKCHNEEGNQLWIYLESEQLLFHPESELCLAENGNGQLEMIKCTGSTNEQWLIGGNTPSHYHVFKNEL